MFDRSNLTQTTALDRRKEFINRSFRKLVSYYAGINDEPGYVCVFHYLEEQGLPHADRPPIRIERKKFMRLSYSALQKLIEIELAIANVTQ